MKTFKITVLFLFISISIMAQVGISFKAGGGVSLPNKPTEFKDNYKMGFNAGGGVSIDLLGFICVEGEVEYNKFALDADKLLKSIGYANYGISISGGNATILSIMANAKAYLLPSVSPIRLYVLAGAGTATLKTEDIKASSQGYSQTEKGESQSKVGFQAGAGIQVGVGSIALFAEAKYVNINTENKTVYMPVKAGLIFKLN